MREKPLSITNAQYGLSQEMPGRMRRYFISMMIRSVCFVGAIIAPNPYRWFLMVGALVLPYISVVIANAGQEKTEAFEPIESRKPIEW